VEVAIPGAGIAVRTDAQGRFRLPGPLPAEEILVARLENYLPYSQSTGNGEIGRDRPWQLPLERWDPNTTLVLEANVIRLGDNRYSPESAAASQFLGPAQAVEMTRSFTLERLPPRPPVLRIGSLIGLDTAAAYRAGQSRIPTADMSPLQVLLNGVEVEQVQLGGRRPAHPSAATALAPGFKHRNAAHWQNLGSDRRDRQRPPVSVFLFLVDPCKFYCR
jgi:hypothetical protein